MEASEINELYERSQLSDNFKELKNSRNFSLYEQHVLDKLYKGAFEAFTNVNPQNEVEVIQTQMMGKIINRIRQEIDKIIDDGTMARQLLSQLNEEE
jgi:predicted RecB family nuclease